MAVVGTTNSLPLIHLLQVKTSEPGTLRVLVEGSRGAGALVMRAGRIVHATYAGQQGEAAAKAVLFERAISYILTSNVNVQGGTVDIPLRQLLLDGPPDWLDEVEVSSLEKTRKARNLEAAEAEARRPAAPASAPVRVASWAVSANPVGASPPSRDLVVPPEDPVPPESIGPLEEVAPEVTAPAHSPNPLAASSASTEPSSPSRSVRPARRRGVPLLAVIPVAVSALALSGWLAFGRSGALPGANVPGSGSTAVAPASRPSTGSGPIEAAELTGPGDRLPELVSGEAPTAEGGVLRPTIVCRILVNEEGGVDQASVYRSRAELVELEAQALEVVRGFRFEPARRDGAKVSVWVNWPIEFR